MLLASVEPVSCEMLFKCHMFASCVADMCLLKAMIDEDRLLSRLGLLENQLSVYAKVTFTVLD